MHLFYLQGRHKLQISNIMLSLWFETKPDPRPDVSLCFAVTLIQEAKYLIVSKKRKPMKKYSKTHFDISLHKLCICCLRRFQMWAVYNLKRIVLRSNGNNIHTFMPVHPSYAVCSCKMALHRPYIHKCFHFMHERYFCQYLWTSAGCVEYNCWVITSISLVSFWENHVCISITTFACTAHMCFKCVNGNPYVTGTSTVCLMKYYMSH